MELDRGKWELTNLPKYLNIKLFRPRNPKRRRSVVEDNAVSGKSCSNVISVKCENIADYSVTSRQETIPASLPNSCSKCKVNRLINSQIYLQNQRLRRLVARTRALAITFTETFCRK